MIFLILNISTHSNLKFFEKFCKVLDDYFGKNINNDVQNKFYKLYTLNDLNEYIFVPDLYKPNKNQCARKFDLIDFVFIYGKCNFLPWEQKGQKINQFLRQCISTQKPLFVCGSAILNYVYNMSIDFKDFNVLNDVKKDLISDYLIQNKCPKNQNDVLIDPSTGDVFLYNFKKFQWQAKLNIGFFHKEKGIEPSFHLKHLFKDPKENSRLNFCEINMRHINNYLFDKVPKKFPAYIPNQWRINTVESINYANQFQVLATNFSRATIIMKNNQILSYAMITSEKCHLVQILYNFLTFQINNLRTLKKKNLFCAEEMSKAANKTFEKDKIKTELLEDSKNNIQSLLKLKHCGMSIRRKNLLGFCEQNCIQNQKSAKYILRQNLLDYKRRQKKDKLDTQIKQKEIQINPKITKNKESKHGKNKPCLIQQENILKGFKCQIKDVDTIVQNIYKLQSEKNYKVQQKKYKSSKALLTQIKLFLYIKYNINITKMHYLKGSVIVSHYKIFCFFFDFIL